MEDEFILTVLLQKKFMILCDQKHTHTACVISYFVRQLNCDRLTIITRITAQLCKNDCLLNSPPNLKTRVTIASPLFEVNVIIKQIFFS